jgi:hypothetical protein
MAEAFDVDPALLGGIAGRLRRAGDELDALGGSMPDTPDAGEVSGALGAVLAHLAAGAGNLVVGLREVGDRVTSSRDGYVDADTDAARGYRGVG